MHDFLNMMRRARHAMRDADGAGAGAAASAETSGTSETPEPQPFDELIKTNKAYQRELDKRITGAINTAKAKWDADAKAQAAEAEKLAQMNAEEKAKHEREKAEQKLSEREAAVTKRELQAEAKSQLAEKGLPAELSEVLDYSSAEKCRSSIEAVETAFSKAVDKAVKERLKGSTPRTGANNTGNTPADSLKSAIRERYKK